MDDCEYGECQRQSNLTLGRSLTAEAETRRHPYLLFVRSWYSAGRADLIVLLTPSPLHEEDCDTV